MRISDEVIKILEYLGEKIGVTIDWTSNNVFPYIEQLCEKYVLWEVSTSFAWIVIMVCVSILTLIFTTIIKKVSDWGGFNWFIFVVVLAISIFVIGYQVFDIIECKTFPEKAIYDYIGNNFNTNTR